MPSRFMVRTSAQSEAEIRLRPFEVCIASSVPKDRAPPDFGRAKKGCVAFPALSLVFSCRKHDYTKADSKKQVEMSHIRIPMKTYYESNPLVSCILLRH